MKSKISDIFYFENNLGEICISENEYGLRIFCENIFDRDRIIYELNKKGVGYKFVDKCNCGRVRVVIQKQDNIKKEKIELGCPVFMEDGKRIEICDRDSDFNFKKVIFVQEGYKNKIQVHKKDGEYFWFGQGTGKDVKNICKNFDNVDLENFILIISYEKNNYLIEDILFYNDNDISEKLYLSRLFILNKFFNNCKKVNFLLDKKQLLIYNTSYESKIKMIKNVGYWRKVEYNLNSFHTIKMEIGEIRPYEKGVIVSYGIYKNGNFVELGKKICDKKINKNYTVLCQCDEIKNGNYINLKFKKFVRK